MRTVSGMFPLKILKKRFHGFSWGKGLMFQKLHLVKYQGAFLQNYGGIFSLHVLFSQKKYKEEVNDPSPEFRGPIVIVKGQ